MSGPVNMFLGSDPLLRDSANLEEQLKIAEAYQQKLKVLQELQSKTPVSEQPKRLIWDDIDDEISPMSEEQRNRLFQDHEYVSIYNELQGLVQAELLNMVKSKVEGTSKGKELLTNQLKIVKRLKGKIIEDTNREMELFKKFKETSRSNPSLTYEEFIKQNV